MTAKRFLLVATAMLATALQSSSHAEENAMNNASLTAFAERYASAWSGQDPVAFASFYAENGSLRINEGDPAIGRAAVTRMAADFMAGFPDMTVRLVRLELDAGRVNFHWHWTGTNTGPGGTGNAVDLTGYETWTLDDDGLILESLGHLDEVEYERQLNAGLAPPAGS